jgi:spore coat polysaccharide biosynthesis protein SpsF (cytidylyltransferase family)
MKDNTARCLDTENLVEECEQELTCRICLQFMVHPSYADCGHVFGGNCIKRWKGDCPFCRQKITKLTVHEELK